MNGGGGGEHHHHHHNHHETSNESSASSSSNGGSSSSGVASGSGDSMVYDEAFPSLPSSGGVGPAAWPIGGRSVVSSSGEAKLPVRKNQHTSQMIHLSPDECKSQTFGNETRKKCEEIAATLGVKVEMCMSRDQTLHINISGNEEKVLEAKRGIINELKVEVESKMKIPKEQHKFLIGKSGAILKGSLFLFYLFRKSKVNLINLFLCFLNFLKRFARENLYENPGPQIGRQLGFDLDSRPQRRRRHSDPRDSNDRGQRVETKRGASQHTQALSSVVARHQQRDRHRDIDAHGRQGEHTATGRGKGRDRGVGRAREGRGCVRRDSTHLREQAACECQANCLADQQDSA